MDTINYGLLKGLLKQVVASGVLKGEPGKGFVILGTYDSLELLKATVTEPSPGDSYNIGTSEPYNVYQWDGVRNDWINLGSLKGDKGDKGDTGDRGEDGTNGINGTNGKSAYEYAQEAGFTGTEEEFSMDLNEVRNKVSTIICLTDNWQQENDYWVYELNDPELSNYKINLSLADDESILYFSESNITYLVGITSQERNYLKCYGEKPIQNLTIQIEQNFIKEV